MKILLFISYLWAMAFTQILFASNDKVETRTTPAASQAQVESFTFVKAEPLYCRENVSEEVSFEKQEFSTKLETNCDSQYAFNQMKVSEDRERHEFRVWSELQAPEVIFISADARF